MTFTLCLHRWLDVDKRYIKLNDTDYTYRLQTPSHLIFCVEHNFLLDIRTNDNNNFSFLIVRPSVIADSTHFRCREGLGVVAVTRVRPSKMGVDTCTRQHIIRARASSIVELCTEDGGSSKAAVQN